MDENTIQCPYRCPYSEDSEGDHRDIFGRFGLIEFPGLREISDGHHDPDDSSQHFEEAQHENLLSM